MSSALHSADVLTEGRWAAVRGIQRWQADPPPVELQTFDPAARACWCGATVTQTCRTKRGHRTRNHDGRTLPRVCSHCGGSVGWKRQVCDGCRRTGVAA